MRALFLFLILSNGLLYLWQSYFVAPEENALQSLNGSVPELVLLEDLVATAQPPKIPDRVVTEVLEEQVDEPVVATNEQDNQQVAENLQVSATFVDSAQAFVSIKNSCFTVGPFINDGELEKVLGIFTERDLTYNQRTFTEPELFGYNVLIPPLATRAEATEMVKALTKKGITDYYIMTEPKFKNAISLGLFREHRFAIQHLELLQNKGVNAEMQTRYFDRSRHWLDYTDVKDEIDLEELARLSPESDVQRLSRACS